jgi:hypothetical protein
MDQGPSRPMELGFVTQNLNPRRVCRENKERNKEFCRDKSENNKKISWRFYWETFKGREYVLNTKSSQKVSRFVPYFL